MGSGESMSLNYVMTAHADEFRAIAGVTSKMSIPTMTKLLGYMSWDRKNLLKGTSDQYKNVYGTGWAVSSTVKGVLVTDDMIGKSFTYAATIKNGTDKKIRLVTYCLNGDNNGNKLKVNLGTDEVDIGEEKDIYLTFTCLPGSTYLRVDVESTDVRNIPVRYSYKNERLYEGTEPGIWTPNPADIVGGVAKALLCALLPVRGCAA